jgi:hypothetical protein
MNNDSNNQKNSSPKKNIEHISSLENETPSKKIKLNDDNIVNKSDNEEDYLIKEKKNRFYCFNKNCDHKKYYPRWYDKNIVDLKEVNNLKDLIKLGEYYHCRMRRYYNNIDLKLLFSIKNYLIDLDSMIGLHNIKEEVVNLIIYLLIMKNSNKGLNAEMFHTVITGMPGCGKTTFIEILAKIYTRIGILKYGHIVKVKRSDLIGKYLGHTAVQTQKKIDEAKDGILLIDEAYSLGNPEGRDSFSKECLDTLNQALSENKDSFICIIAGYKNALENSFFSYNEGLRRRFPFRFDIEKYNYKELSEILMKKIIEYNYYEIKFTNDELIKLIKENNKYFINQGGDMETLFLNIKITHNKRVFLLPTKEKHYLYLNDLIQSIDKFIKLKGDFIEKNQSLLSSIYV